MQRNAIQRELITIDQSSSRALFNLLHLMGFSTSSNIAFLSKRLHIWVWREIYWVFSNLVRIDRSTKIVESIIRNENAVSTVSCPLEDYHGVSDICLSVPVILNRSGVKETIKLPLDEEEIAQFQKFAAIIKNVADSLRI